MEDRTLLCDFFLLFISPLPSKLLLLKESRQQVRVFMNEPIPWKYQLLSVAVLEDALQIISPFAQRPMRFQCFPFRALSLSRCVFANGIGTYAELLPDRLEGVRIISARQPEEKKKIVKE